MEKKQKHNKNKHTNHNTFRDINLRAKPGTADFRWADYLNLCTKIEYDPVLFGGIKKKKKVVSQWRYVKINYFYNTSIVQPVI